MPFNYPQIAPRWTFSLIASFLIIFSAGCQDDPALRMDTITAKSKHAYSVFSWNDSLIPDFVTERPSTDDQTVYLCIPAAFTQLEDDKIDGLYANNGKVGNADRVNGSIGGGLLIEGGKLSLFDTKADQALDSLFIASLAKNKSDFFQQILMVKNGKAEIFRDTKVFQRRAIVEFNDGRFGVIEADRPASLAQFAADLVELGVKNALYTDMGAWDEGWYRYGQAVVKIGRLKSQTARQSNWFIVKSN
jgi:hypothetical protein